MENIRPQALQELARVARRFVVMIEPFHDWNAEGVPRQYVQVRKYFDAQVGELPRYGMRAVVATADFPNKVTFRAGLVIAEVVR
jgi:hypothetical protein